MEAPVLAVQADSLTADSMPAEVSNDGCSEDAGILRASLGLDTKLPVAA